MKKKDNLNKCNGFKDSAQEPRKVHKFEWAVGQ